MPVLDTFLAPYDEALRIAGYRAITLRSFNDLIGGVRYVSIETDARSTQLIPADTKSAWAVYTFSGLTETCRYAGVSRRSRMERCTGSFALNPPREWFAKPSLMIGSVLSPSSIRFHAGYHFQVSFYEFISREIGGYENEFDVSLAFDRAHSVNPDARLSVELERRQAELDSRESQLAIREAFREVEQIKAEASLLATQGDYTGANRLNRISEEVRRSIQADLDNQRPLGRYGDSLIASTPRARAFYYDSRGNPSVANTRPSAAAAEQTAPLRSLPRKIILGED